MKTRTLLAMLALLAAATLTASTAFAERTSGDLALTQPPTVTQHAIAAHSPQTALIKDAKVEDTTRTSLGSALGIFTAMLKTETAGAAIYFENTGTTADMTLSTRTTTFETASSSGTQGTYIANMAIGTTTSILAYTATIETCAGATAHEADTGKVTVSVDTGGTPRMTAKLGIEDRDIG